MTSRRARTALTVVAACTVLGLAAACSSSDQPSSGGGSGGAAAQPASAQKIKAVASTNVWGSVLNAVGGDRVDVTSIIHDPNADPHSYESTPQDGLAVKDARLTLGNGGGYDDFFKQLTAGVSGAENLVAYDIAATGDGNEHVWYSLPSVDRVADAVATALGDVQPASKQVFTGNATAFKGKVDALYRKVTDLGAAHPGEKVVGTEPVAHYLLEAAKTTDVTPEEFAKAVESQSDVPAAAVQQVKQLLTGKQVKALVDNVQAVTPVTADIVGTARSAGVPVVDVTETLPAGVTGYIDWMARQVDALARALNG